MVFVFLFLTSLSKIISRPIHVAANGIVFLLFLYLSTCLGYEVCTISATRTVLQARIRQRPCREEGTQSHPPGTHTDHHEDKAGRFHTLSVFLTPSPSSSDSAYHVPT